MHNWKTDKINRIEPYLHAIPITLGLGMAIVGLPLELYNPSFLFCSIASLPRGCAPNECTRGQHANIYAWALLYGPVWILIFIITVAVTLVSCHVRKIEAKSNAYKFRGVQEDDDTTRRRRNVAGNLKRTKQVARQCFGYAAGFYVCWVPATVSTCFGVYVFTSNTGTFL